MISRSAISLGGKGDSASAKMLSTKPEAGLRSKGWSKPVMRLMIKSDVNTRFIAHSVALALELG